VEVGEKEQVSKERGLLVLGAQAIRGLNRVRKGETKNPRSGNEREDSRGSWRRGSARGHGGRGN